MRQDGKEAMQKYKGEDENEGKRFFVGGEWESMEKARRIVYEAIWMCGY